MLDVQLTGIEDLVVITPEVHTDIRGYLFESFTPETLIALGIEPKTYVKHNKSFSRRGVLRGFHFQEEPYSQAKYVGVDKGAVLDVVVDLRPESRTFGHTYSVILSEENRKTMFVPERFGHAYLSLSGETKFEYLCFAPYNKSAERGLLWNSLEVDWELKRHCLSEDDLIIKETDREWPTFAEYKATLSKK